MVIRAGKNSKIQVVYPIAFTFVFCSYKHKTNYLGVVFYNIFLALFRIGSVLFSFFDPKAKKWLAGRKAIFTKLESALQNTEHVIWIHCASLGEFEQGRPLMEQIRKQYTNYKLLLTFFSPSGYEVRKNYEGADWVFYLPMDGPKTAKRFLDIVQPELVIFVKYEFWYYYLKKIKYRNIPLLLVSALFRKDMSFFKWYGSLQRKILSRFDHLFVQDEASRKLIEEIGLGGICSVSGDTRFDRVIEIASGFQPIPYIREFTGENRTLVAGSTWPDDEEVLQKAFNHLNDPGLKLIIAPHEINAKHLDELQLLFKDAVRYSTLTNRGMKDHPRILIIDNIGLLSRLYYYGDIAYVGGGLRKSGIHNVLEAAVFDKVILFGPNYTKYREAVGLVQSGGAIPFYDEKRDGLMLSQLVQALLLEPTDRSQRARVAGEFVRKRQGATQTILRFIQEKRLLTS